MMGKKVMIQFLASGLSGLLAFLALSLSARLFGAKILGEIAYLTGLLGIIFAFSDLGLSRAHVHFTAAKSGRPALASFLTLKLVLLFLCAALALALGAFNRQLSLLLLVLLVFEFFFRLADGLLITFEGQEKVWPQNLIRLSGKLFKLAAVVVLGLVWSSSLGYSLVFLTEAMLVLAAAAVISRRFWSWRLDKAVMKDYWRYSLPFALIVPLSYFQENGLILIIRNFYSAETLGVYAAVLGLFGLLKGFSSGLMVFFFPRMSRFNAAGEIDQIQRYTDSVVKLSVWILAPLCLLLFLLAGPVVTLVLGGQFAGGAGVFRWLLLGVLILAVFTPYDHVLFATNNHRSIVKVNLVTTVLVLTFAWLLVPGWAGQGAALALVSGWLIGGVWQFLILHQKTGIRFLRDWRLSKVEVKYLYGLIHSFGQAVFRFSGKKTG
ncbi:hypothetical protein COX09_04330 [Candidatus Beckwithbacteria bacterium CG23_combo_of_CG06-09_8_20_14_all_47_9]|uniref:Polysaccharide biosynthesis protein C-terminal domain-containing protein n=1 Tax=Candidatus Beckwithbacteria bacterium CG23_combo_of_CG06-09_8_20_14_all_47_9 TaxID=1974498 RepID=A0A2H0B4F3_9BACT|nr:MAG: hypothetical protein COX09_04330 [Candidatus Beckwithbacteria bacterium CG23_combo_of_CG06-09_8_20_14_all_47_9]